MVSTPHSGGDPAAKEVRLLGAFEIRIGRRIELPPAQQRLIAFVALCGRLPTPRAYIAGNLWPMTTDVRSTANLRTSLWRIRHKAPGFIAANQTCVWLESDVVVDVEQVDQRVEQCVDGLAHDLLPGWYDDWLVAERERFRQALIHAIEARTRQLVDAGRFGQAIDLAWKAVRAEPLRESAHFLLIEAHLGEGNVLTAVEHYQWWSHVLMEEFGLIPRSELRSAIADAVGQDPKDFDLASMHVRRSVKSGAAT